MSTTSVICTTQDGQQFLIPISGTLDGQIGSMNSSSSSASGGSTEENSLTPQQQVMAVEAGKKRQSRLYKNREAAKECRRKKKEYIKCLENRVAVLENQNKALIEELKSLKELYCKSTPRD